LRMAVQRLLDHRGSGTGTAHDKEFFHNASGTSYPK
jgi:hypothetical protein